MSFSIVYEDFPSYAAYKVEHRSTAYDAFVDLDGRNYMLGMRVRGKATYGIQNEITRATSAIMFDFEGDLVIVGVESFEGKSLLQALLVLYSSKQYDNQERSLAWNMYYVLHDYSIAYMDEDTSIIPRPPGPHYEIDPVRESEEQLIHDITEDVDSHILRTVYARQDLFSRVTIAQSEPRLKRKRPL